jgi:uncharacterized protein (TIGR01244 family)
MLEEITNFYAVTDSLGTSGMPRRDQIADIAAAGYRVVINLAMDEPPAQLAGEAELVRSYGMEYVHIPVAWQDPQPADVQRFFQIMDADQDRRVFVHCVMNYRVSAFVYLYRILRQGVLPEHALHDLNHIWRPDGKWAEFITQMLNEKIDG